MKYLKQQKSTVNRLLGQLKAIKRSDLFTPQEKYTLTAKYKKQLAAFPKEIQTESLQISSLY